MSSPICRCRSGEFRRQPLTVFSPNVPGATPSPGKVRVERLEQTGRGFTIEFEERWDHAGQRWYCREMIRADVVDESIVDMSIYCTGDWDEARQREHAASVTLIRP